VGLYHSGFKMMPSMKCITDRSLLIGVPDRLRPCDLRRPANADELIVSRGVGWMMLLMIHT